MRSRIEAARRQATEALMGELGPGGYWQGELSSSALSTATAVVALALADGEGARDLPHDVGPVLDLDVRLPAALRDREPVHPEDHRRPRFGDRKSVV